MMIDDFISKRLKTYTKWKSGSIGSAVCDISYICTATHGDNSNFHVDSMETTCPMLYPSLANGCQARMPPMLLADVNDGTALIRRLYRVNQKLRESKPRVIRKQTSDNPDKWQPI
jgi:hypothetical protein